LEIELRIWREEYWKALGISMKMSEMAFFVRGVFDAHVQEALA
jgi:hypothetical protein